MMTPEKFAQAYLKHEEYIKSDGAWIASYAIMPPIRNPGNETTNAP